MGKKKLALETLDNVVEFVNEQTPCIILYRGKQVRFPSGKSAWNSKRSASAALTNALGLWFYGNEELRKEFKNAPELRKYLVEKGIVVLKEFGDE